MAERIDMPFEPENHVGEWGFFWDEDGESEGQWHLCYVWEDSVGNLFVRAWDREPERGFLDLTEASVKGQPFLPCHWPCADPGAALEVATRLDGGASMTLTVVDPARAAEIWDSIASLTQMAAGGRASGIGPKRADTE